MILIISSEEDLSTNDVIDWLRYYNVNYIRISHETRTTIHRIEITDNGYLVILNINDVLVNLDEVKSVWYRRSWLEINHKKYSNEIIKKKEFLSNVNVQLREENIFLTNFIENELRVKSLNQKMDTLHNKLATLVYAKKIGLEVPKTIVTNSKEELINFKKKYKNIITKNFSPGVFIKLDGIYLNGYTIVVKNEMIDELPYTFYPMLFQNQIEKQFEIRSFYINESFFSSAIFSQNDEKTIVDFRNYNLKKPNRTPPFKLPPSIEEKLILVMKEFDLNSGSIDLIVDKEGNFVLLEINPIGQFAQVSIPCNYYIEHEIAKSLINNYHGREN